MKLCSFLKLLPCVLAVFFTTSLIASTWTDWTEYPTDPIYNPYPSSILPEDYFPCVIFDKHKFHDDGDSVYYKMWHQSANGIALSYSDDGIHWTLKGDTNLANGFHPCVVYDKNGFGGGSNHYKIWFWTGSPSTTIDVIQYAESTDGITWTTPVAVTQNPSSPLVDGITPGYFYHLYGPGFVLYNSSPTSIAGLPYTFPYVMFYDTSSEGLGPGSSVEQIGLAYSSDGLNWTRFGSEPILIPSGIATDWDGTHAFRPSVINVHGTYHLFYSGSNDNIDPDTTVPYAHGIGHASSADGINWALDSDNPIFIYSDGIAWRNTRTYTPFVLFGKFCSKHCNCLAKMWFTGGAGLTPGENQAIGYATLPCPRPTAPTNLQGRQYKAHIFDKSELINELTWSSSASPFVVGYHIYRDDALISTVPATDPLIYLDLNRSDYTEYTYSVTAVDDFNSESDPVTITMP